MVVQSAEPIRVLLVHADHEFSDAAADHLTRADESISVKTAPNVDRGLESLATADVDCVVSGYELPDGNGIDFLEAVRADHDELPFFIVTGEGSETVASDAITAGVTDYLEKDGRTEQYAILANRIRNAVDRRRARQAAETSEHRISRIYERITDGFFGVDRDWRYTYVNEEGARLVGLDREELLGEVVWEVFPNLVDSPFESALRTAMEAQETTTVEAHYPAHDTWYDVRVYPDEDGISIYFQDVTDRKEREKEIVDERDRYTALFENLPNPVVHGRMRDGEVVVEDVNPAFVERFGYDADEFEDLNLHDAILPEEESADRDPQNPNRALLSDGRLQTEVRRETVDGVRDFQVNVTMENPEAAEPEGYAIYTDITDRKRREAELERYETLVETVAGGVFAQDEDANYSFVNSYIEEKTGYDREEIIGEDPSLFMPEEDIQEISHEIGEMLEGTRETVTFETEIETADGETIPAEGRLALLPGEDGFQGTVGMIRDITERKERERELKRQKDRFEEFTTVVSHDLRNPLTVAQGQLELAMEECPSDHVEKAIQAQDRMWMLIEDLLTLAREGQEAAEMEPVSVGELVEDCWLNVETADGSLEADVDSRIRADPSRLQQLLENLMRNAIEHGGESVTVRVDELSDGFYVADDGPGIPPDDREDVFEAGYSSAEDGTGFGLSIVRQVAEAHDWDLRLDESEDGGARFEIRGVEFA